MSLLLIHKNLVEAIESTADCPAEIEKVEEETGIVSLCAFLRAYKDKPYVLVRSDDPAALIRHLRETGAPDDAIVELIRKENHQN